MFYVQYYLHSSVYNTKIRTIPFFFLVEKSELHKGILSCKVHNTHTALLVYITNS